MRIFSKNAADVAEKKIADTSKTIIQRLYAKRAPTTEILNTEVKQTQTDLKTLGKKVDKSATNLEQVKAPKSTRQQPKKTLKHETPSVLQNNTHDASSTNQSSSYNPYSIDEHLHPERYRPDNGYYEYPAYVASPFDLDVPKIWGSNKGSFK